MLTRHVSVDVNVVSRPVRTSECVAVSSMLAKVDSLSMAREGHRGCRPSNEKRPRGPVSGLRCCLHLPGTNLHGKCVDGGLNFQVWRCSLSPFTEKNPLSPNGQFLELS